MANGEKITGLTLEAEALKRVLGDTSLEKETKLIQVFDLAENDFSRFEPQDLRKAALVLEGVEKTRAFAGQIRDYLAGLNLSSETIGSGEVAAEIGQTQSGTAGKLDLTLMMDDPSSFATALKNLLINADHRVVLQGIELIKTLDKSNAPLVAAVKEALASLKEEMGLDVFGQQIYFPGLFLVPMEFLPDNFLKFFAELTSIRLPYVFLPKKWDLCPKLREVFMYFMDTLEESLPDVSEWVNITKLGFDWAGPQMRNGFPKGLFQLTGLTELRLPCCELSTLPAEMANLQNLRVLDLTGNSFNEFPEVILELTNLVKLDLTDGKFSRIPPEIGRLQNLEVLGLSWTLHLGEVPSEVFKLPKLKTIIADGSRIIWPKDTGHCTIDLDHKFL